MANKLLTIFAFLLLSFAAYGSTDCQSTFTAGSGLSLVKFCVTANGNVADFEAAESPGFTVPLINGEEGYAVGANGQCYYDSGLNGDSGNWQPSVIIQPHGPNTFPLTIQRTTADGVLTLTQQFKWIVGKAGISVTMIADAGNYGADIIRYAKLAGDSYPPMASKTYNSGFAWTQAPQGVGIGGNGLAAFQFPKPLARVYIVLPAQNLCDTFTMPDVPYQGDAAIVMEWQINRPSKNNPATFNYSAMR